MVSVESVIAKAEAEQRQRENEVYVKTDASEVVLVDLDQKELTPIKRGGYDLYGIKVEHEGRSKTLYLFLSAVPQLFKVARDNGGRVVVSRSGSEYTFA